MTTNTTETNDAEVAPKGPTYGDARRVAASALMFDEPALARTRKTAEVVAERVIDALIAANITAESVTKPVVGQQETLNVTA